MAGPVDRPWRPAQREWPKPMVRKKPAFDLAAAPSAAPAPGTADAPAAGASAAATSSDDKAFRAVLDQLPVPVTISRLDNDRLIYANDAWFAIADVRRDAALGHRVLGFYEDPADRDRMKAELIKGGYLHQFEARLRFAGRSVWAQMRCVRTTFDGRACSLVVFQDVTDAKQAEQRLLAAKEAAESANRMKTQFLARMSHELRTPLNAIIGFADLIHGQAYGAVGNPRYVEYAGNIHESGGLLLRLIDDILDLAKLEAGKARLMEGPVDIAEPMAAALRQVAAQAEGAKVALALDPGAASFTLSADQRRVTQILINLLSNAIKFTPSGGKVSLSSAITPCGEGQVTIADTGIGISKGDLKHIVEPFYQVESSLSRRYGGTGLGLAIVRSLVDMHGGRLEMESEAGHGTVARVLFPAERLAHAQAH